MSLTWTVMRDIRDCMEKKCWKWSWMETGEMMAYTMTEGYAMGVPSEHYLATIRTGYQEAGFDEDVLMAGVEKSRERMKQEMEAERMEEAPWSQQLPL